MRTGAQCVVEELQNVGVKTIFGLPGGSVLDIFDNLFESPLRFILARHEQGAAHMADGYARATGKVGCCLVTSGPGATNTVTGLATAHMDSIPIVCISGQVPLSMIGNDAFQEADTVGITRAVTKHNYLVRAADDIPRIIHEAFHIARTGRPGPVLIDLPKSVQRETTTMRFDGRVNIPGYRPSTKGHPKQIEKLAAAVTAAKRPLIYAGGGVILGNAATELTRLARKARIPVTTTLLGLGGFPETDKLALGMLGMHGAVAANFATSQCDLLISVGARFDDRVTGKTSEFAPKAVKAHIDIDPAAISMSVQADIPVVGDVKLVLNKLLDVLKPGNTDNWLAKTAQWKKEAPLAYDRKSKMLLPQYVIAQIDKITKGKAIVVTDVGQHQMWAAQFYTYTKPRTFISSGGLGTMGFGLPAAIGAQTGCPNKLVVAIVGDGSIQMNFQELVVAVEQKLPINVVILNNNYLGMVRQWQEMFYSKRYSSTHLHPARLAKPRKGKAAGQTAYLPDFVRLAEAHGALGLRARTPKELSSVLRRAFETHGPVVIECLVNPEENVYPMVPAGATLTEMVHSMA